MAQQGLDVIAGLSQPIALHIPAEGGGSHPAGIISRPPPRFLRDNFSTWDHRADAARAPPQFTCSSPEMLPLVQRIQEVVGHDVVPHQVVPDASWKRGSGPNSPQPYSGQALATPPAPHAPPVGTQAAHCSLEGYEQQAPTPAPPRGQATQSRVWGVPGATPSTSPHSASFMPVSTSPSFGGSTPGVSTRYIRGFSQTWERGGRAARKRSSVTSTVDSGRANEGGVELSR